MSHLEPRPDAPGPDPAASGATPADALPAASTATLDAAADTPSVQPGRSVWWRRNRMWVRLLIPLVLLALAATSFRVVRILLPIIEWSAPQVAHGPQLTFRQTKWVAPGKRVPREVTITVESVREMTSIGAYRPDPGARLYQVDLAFEAAPDVPLSDCYVYLRDARGTLYGTTLGQTRDPSSTIGGDVWQHCIPKDTYDPEYDTKTGELLPRPPGRPDRPRNWSNFWAVAVPEQVEPTQVVVRWYNNEPEYAVLDLPR